VDERQADSWQTVGISGANIHVPADVQSQPLGVEVPGYAIWSLEIPGETQAGRCIIGPVHLRRP
jgi:hypothetical protein